MFTPMSFASLGSFSCSDSLGKSPMIHSLRSSSPKEVLDFAWFGLSRRS
jgi:hypothetical protein